MRSLALFTAFSVLLVGQAFADVLDNGPSIPDSAFGGDLSDTGSAPGSTDKGLDKPEAQPDLSVFGFTASDDNGPSGSESGAPSIGISRSADGRVSSFIDDTTTDDTVFFAIGRDRVAGGSADFVQVVQPAVRGGDAGFVPTVTPVVPGPDAGPPPVVPPVVPGPDAGVVPVVQPVVVGPDGDVSAVPAPTSVLGLASLICTGSIAFLFRRRRRS